ncbi:glutathione S-transferase family protein [Pseudomonas yamanorum]|uniref:glutathione S-transferase family protein n=1 Tax=Pseudomonas yamanorum TaxID=515393 RepID=UPI003D35AFCC
MLIVHAFATPNSVKVPIALEELGLDYQLLPVNIRQGEQKHEAFIALNANAKVPVLVDPVGDKGQPIVLTESAAILIYLSERYGRLLPSEGVKRARVFEQLFFHASALSPAFGQSGYFQKLTSEPNPAAIARFHGEAKRILAVLDGVLADTTYVAGDEFSIADIAHFGWLWRKEFAGVDFALSPHVERWYNAVSRRPAVLRGIERTNALTPQA